MELTILETQRLYLRRLDQPLFDFIFTKIADPELAVFLGLKSEEELLAEREKYKLGFGMFNKTFLYFQLLEKESLRVLGWCGFHTWYKNHFRAELGYVIHDSEFHSKGLMTEAIGPIIGYGFNALNLNRIEAFVGSDNLASLGILKKQKFKNEGLLKSHYFKNGIAEDSLVFALLREEWLASDLNK